MSFDATNPRPVPKNVLHVVNFFQQNGFGKQVTAAPDFKGQLSNVDLTAETGLSHTTIDKSPRLHAMVMRKIAGVVEQDLVKRHYRAALAGAFFFFAGFSLLALTAYRAGCVCATFPLKHSGHVDVPESKLCLFDRSMLLHNEGRRHV